MISTARRRPRTANASEAHWMAGCCRGRSRVPHCCVLAAVLFAALARGAEEPCSCRNGRMKLFGPGGPHTALIPAAELYNVLDPLREDIEICFGPESTWRAAALECSAGLFAAAEQQMSGLLRVYSTVIDVARPVVRLCLPTIGVAISSKGLRDRDTNRPTGADHDARQRFDSPAQQSARHHWAPRCHPAGRTASRGKRRQLSG